MSSNTINLSIGCGHVRFPGWTHVDINASYKPDIVQDILQGLPFEENSVDFIHSEHFIEHFTAQDGVKIFTECFRVLKPGGVVRTATFCLDKMMEICRPDNPNWRKEAFLKEARLEWVKTRAEIINISFRAWEHKYVYNPEEMIRRLGEAGFTKTNVCEKGQSTYEALKNLEHMYSTNLVVEGVK